MKPLIIMEGKSTLKYVKPALKKAYGSFDMDFFGTVLYGDAPLCRHEDGWYQYGKPSGYTPIVLSDIEIPPDTYLAKPWAGSRMPSETPSEILFLVNAMPDSDLLCDMFAAKRYQEMAGLPMDACTCALIGDYHTDMVLESLSAAQPFESVYFHGKQMFYSMDSYEVRPYINPFVRILKLSGMTLTRFCEYFHIPRSTAENWKYGNSECPEYFLELMEYKLLQEKLI